MNLTNDFLIQAQGCIERVFRSYREEQINKSGNIETSMKPNHTVVTELDKTIEKDLRASLLKLDSSIGIEGEELGIEGSRETYWLVDPIDGTDSFVRGIPIYRNVVTLIDNGQPVFALVYRPVTDELFVAAEGEGVYRNGKPVNIGNRPLDRATIDIMGRLDDLDIQAAIRAIQPAIDGVRRTSDFLPVVQGQLDGQLSLNTGAGPWDFAPRALLIREAGGRVANIGSDTYDFKINNFLGTNPVIFDDLMKMITGAISK